MLLLIWTLGLLNLAQAQDYSYPRPQIPFHLTPQQQHTATRPPTRYIVQTLGPHGRTYELQTQPAHTVYEGHQTITMPGSYHHQPQQQQQQFQQIQQQPQQHQQIQPIHHQQFQQQYQQQQQLHQQHLQQHTQQHHVQQLPQNLYANPQLVSTNYQQLPVDLTAPTAPAKTYYIPPHPQFQAPAQVPVQSHVQPAAATYYAPPQALTVNTATHAQPFAEYGPPPLPELPEPQPQYSSSLPYAIVTLPNGQRVADAGHGSGAPPAASGQAARSPPRLSDYSSQSQSASLDAFGYKQTVPGETRSFQRFVTKCLPNGQCQRLNLNPGQIDPDHQQVLQAAHALVVPPPLDCGKTPYIPPGAVVNPQGNLRPQDRRAKKHTDEKLSNYPFN